MRIVFHILVVVLLTVLTQIGGIAYLATLAIFKRPLFRAFAFLVAYFLISVLAVQMSDRIPVRTTTDLRPVNLFAGLQRQYVTPDLNDVIIDLSLHMAKKFPGTSTYALDGSFPLLDGFPLLPHLSHSDGKKIDIAFYYEDNRPKSPIGYFAFEQPRQNDPQPCAARNDRLSLRWDMAWVQPLWRNAELDEVKTAEAIRWLATVGRREGGVTKIFVEPHLVRRLGLQDLNLNFQGCRAARHDDHIHFQVE